MGVDEPVESAALQILNVIFSVPQVSVRLAEFSPEHREMTGFWMKCRRANRDLLLDDQRSHGEEVDQRDLSEHPRRRRGNGATGEVDIINARPGGTVVLRLDKDFGLSTVAVRDCRGNTLRAETRELAAGAHVLEVSASGLLEIRRQPAR